MSWLDHMLQAPVFSRAGIIAACAREDIDVTDADIQSPEPGHVVITVTGRERAAPFILSFAPLGISVDVVERKPPPTYWERLRHYKDSHEDRFDDAGR